MKLKISESKVREIVNEEVFKRRLTKTLKESQWPSYTAYLGAEILKLEWQQRLLQEGKGKYDDGDGKDEKCDYVDCEDEEKKELDEQYSDTRSDSGDKDVDHAVLGGNKLYQPLCPQNQV